MSAKQGVELVTAEQGVELMSAGQGVESRRWDGEVKEKRNQRACCRLPAALHNHPPVCPQKICHEGLLVAFLSQF